MLEKGVRNIQRWVLFRRALTEKGLKRMHWAHRRPRGVLYSSDAP